MLARARYRSGGAPAWRGAGRLYWRLKGPSRKPDRRLNIPAEGQAEARAKCGGGGNLRKGAEVSL